MRARLELGNLLESSALAQELGNGSQVSLQLEHSSCNDHPCELLLGEKRAAKHQQHHGVSRRSGQSSRALRRASSSQQLPPGRAGSSSQSTTPTQDFHHCSWAEPCCTSPHLSVYSGNAPTHIASAPASGLWCPLVQAGLHLGSSMTKFWSHFL